MDTVFVSYSSKDRKFVNNIVKTIEDMGIQCWKAPENIPAGSSYAREIPKAIADCQVFLLMLSKTSQDSIWVEKEVDNAIANRKQIIPFQIDKEPLNEVFRFYLNNIQMICYWEDPFWAVEDLKSQLSEMVFGKEYIPAGREDNPALLEESPIIENRRMWIPPVKGGNPASSRQSNALRMNRIPVECQYCGCKDLENVTLGTYRCLKCAKDNYDDFQTIRNYLNKTGSASALIIERDTGVPRKIINYFFREEYLEIPSNSPIRVPCSRCGAPIRTGVLCDACKQKEAETTKTKDTNSRMRSSWFL